MNNKKMIKGLYEAFAAGDGPAVLVAFADGDTVVANGWYRWSHKATGKPCEVRMAHVCTLANGKATSFLQHVDTLRVREQVQ